MLTLGLIETALELVPKDLANHPAIVANAQLRNKPSTQILLDERLHSKAFQNLPDAKKRGRPDIAHRSLLVALDSVLARAGLLKVFVHTYSGDIIQIASETRLPRRIQRFVGLMEQLLLTKRVPPQGSPLLQVVPGNLETYLKTLNPSRTVLLSEKGVPTSPLKLAETLLTETKPVVLVGGFAHGDPLSDLSDLVDQQVSFDPEQLPVSTIVGMLVHGMELASDLITQRFTESD
ncbi:MAG: 16S rRNA methyltransferase [Promethearchaeota archaeon]